SSGPQRFEEQEPEAISQSPIHEQVVTDETLFVSHPQKYEEPESPVQKEYDEHEQHLKQDFEESPSESPEEQSISADQEEIEIVPHLPRSQEMRFDEKPPESVEFRTDDRLSYDDSIAETPAEQPQIVIGEDQHSPRPEAEEQYKDEYETRVESSVPAGIPDSYSSSHIETVTTSGFLSHGESEPLDQSKDEYESGSEAEPRVESRGGFLQTPDGERIEIPHVAERDHPSTTSLAGSDLDQPEPEFQQREDEYRTQFLETQTTDYDRSESAPSHTAVHPEQVQQEPYVEEYVIDKAKSASEAQESPSSPQQSPVREEFVVDQHTVARPLDVSEEFQQYQREQSPIQKTSEFFEEPLINRPADVPYPAGEVQEEYEREQESPEGEGEGKKKSPSFIRKIVMGVAGATVGGAAFAVQKISEKLGKGDEEEKELPPSYEESERESVISQPKQLEELETSHRDEEHAPESPVQKEEHDYSRERSERESVSSQPQYTEETKTSHYEEEHVPESPIQKEEHDYSRERSERESVSSQPQNTEETKTSHYEEEHVPESPVQKEEHDYSRERSERESVSSQPQYTEETKTSHYEEEHAPESPVQKEEHDYSRERSERESVSSQPQHTEEHETKEKFVPESPAASQKGQEYEYPKETIDQESVSSQPHYYEEVGHEEPLGEKEYPDRESVSSQSEVGRHHREIIPESPARDEHREYEFEQKEETEHSQPGGIDYEDFGGRHPDVGSSEFVSEPETTGKPVVLEPREEEAAERGPSPTGQIYGFEHVVPESPATSSEDEGHVTERGYAPVPTDYPEEFLQKEPAQHVTEELSQERTEQYSPEYEQETKDQYETQTSESAQLPESASAEELATGKVEEHQVRTEDKRSPTESEAEQEAIPSSEEGHEVSYPVREIREESIIPQTPEIRITEPVIEKFDDDYVVTIKPSHEEIPHKEEEVTPQEPEAVSKEAGSWEYTEESEPVHSDVQESPIQKTSEFFEEPLEHLAGATVGGAALAYGKISEKFGKGDEEEEKDLPPSYEQSERESVSSQPQHTEETKTSHYEEEHVPESPIQKEEHDYSTERSERESVSSQPQHTEETKTSHYEEEHVPESPIQKEEHDYSRERSERESVSSQPHQFEEHEATHHEEFVSGSPVPEEKGDHYDGERESVPSQPHQFEEVEQKVIPESPAREQDPYSKEYLVETTHIHDTETRDLPPEYETTTDEQKKIEGVQHPSESEGIAPISSQRQSGVVEESYAESSDSEIPPEERIEIVEDENDELPPEERKHPPDEFASFDLPPQGELPSETTSMIKHDDVVESPDEIEAPASEIGEERLSVRESTWEVVGEEQPHGVSQRESFEYVPSEPAHPESHLQGYPEISSDDGEKSVASKVADAVTGFALGGAAMAYGIANRLGHSQEDEPAYEYETERDVGIPPPGYTEKASEESIPEIQISHEKPEEIVPSEEVGLEKEEIHSEQEPSTGRTARSDDFESRPYSEPRSDEVGESEIDTYAAEHPQYFQQMEERHEYHTEEPEKEAADAMEHLESVHKELESEHRHEEEPVPHDEMIVESQNIHDSQEQSSPHGSETSLERFERFERQIREQEQLQFDETSEKSPLQKTSELFEEPLERRPADVPYPSGETQEEYGYEQESPEEEGEKSPNLAKKIAMGIAGATIGGAALAYEKISEKFGKGDEKEALEHRVEEGELPPSYEDVQRESASQQGESEEDREQHFIPQSKEQEIGYSKESFEQEPSPYETHHAPKSPASQKELQGIHPQGQAFEEIHFDHTDDQILSSDRPSEAPYPDFPVSAEEQEKFFEKELPVSEEPQSGGSVEVVESHDLTGSDIKAPSAPSQSVAFDEEDLFNVKEPESFLSEGEEEEFGKPSDFSSQPVEHKTLSSEHEYVQSEGIQPESVPSNFDKEEESPSRKSSKYEEQLIERQDTFHRGVSEGSIHIESSESPAGSEDRSSPSTVIRIQPPTPFDPEEEEATVDTQITPEEAPVSFVKEFEETATPLDYEQVQRVDFETERSPESEKYGFDNKGFEEQSPFQKTSEFFEEPLERRPADVPYPSGETQEEYGYEQESPEEEGEKSPNLAKKIAMGIAGATIGGAALAYGKISEKFGKGDEEEEKDLPPSYEQSERESVSSQPQHTEETKTSHYEEEHIPESPIQKEEHDYSTERSERESVSSQPQHVEEHGISHEELVSGSPVQQHEYEYSKQTPEHELVSSEPHGWETVHHEEQFVPESPVSGDRDQRKSSHTEAFGDEGQSWDPEH
ncbi:hypothetical protein FO519_009352, partial [Halicephalobus sp. NKZ332]